MKNKLKNKLKRLFPPCSATVRSYKEQIEQQNRELYDLLIEIKNQIAGLENEIRLCKNDINQGFTNIDGRIEWWSWERFLRVEQALKLQNDSLMNGLNRNSKTYFWNNGYEKKAISNNYGDLLKDNSLKDKYLALINGLDRKSIETINKILNIQSRYLSCDETKLDLFTLEEQQQLHTIEDKFAREVCKISDDMYAYGSYLLPVNHFEAVTFYYNYCLSEVDNLEQIKGKTIIDAGAFIGDTTLIFSELKPEKIIAFEPILESFELCKKTIKMNGLKNVTLEQKALGAQSGFLDMYIAGEGSTCYPRDEDRIFYADETYKVPVITLDDYVKANNLQVGIIKADIEGAEPDLLRGARQVISEQRPVLLICIYHNKHDFFEIKPMLESWNLGYRFKIRKPIVPNATYETMLIAEPV